MDDTANQLLQEARATFHRMSLDTKVILVSADNIQLFFWRGDRIMYAVVLMLERAGFDVENTWPCITIKTSNPEKLLITLRNLAASPPPDPVTLVTKIMNKQQEKWDNLLPAELLDKNYASHLLDVVGGHQAIHSLMTDNTVKIKAG